MHIIQKEHVSLNKILKSGDVSCISHIETNICQSTLNDFFLVNVFGLLVSEYVLRHFFL